MKAKLLGAVEEGRERETELQALCVDAPANADGRWNAKDHLVHLAWWRLRAARLLDAVRTGGEPPPASEDDTSQNAIVYAENRDRSAADIKSYARDSWRTVRLAIEACTEDDLAKAHPHSPESQVWEIVPGVDGHVGTHLWFWYLEIGDEERAISAATWAYEAECRYFATPAARADAAYNLACLYARLGRPRDAVPLFRASFEAKPSLVELGRRDPDLDPIRDDADLKELLAT